MNESRFGGEHKEKPNPIIELTEDWETSSSLSHVYTDEDTRPLIKKLVQRAKVRYPEDPSWLDTLKVVRDKLNDTDEIDEIKELLIEALGDADEDDLEDTSAEEPEEEMAA